MKTTYTRTFYGEDAEFFIGKCIKISNIEELDRMVTVVKVTFEAEQ